MRARVRAGGESGSAILVAVLLLCIVMAVGLSSARWTVAAIHAQEQRETSQIELERARSAAANVIASLRTDLPAQYDADLDRARTLAGQKPLPSFDATTVPTAASKPVARVNATSGQLERTSYQINSCTSLLGQVDDWAKARIPVAESYASGRGYGSDVVNVASLKEVYRPSVSSTESAYALEYWVDARGGSSARVRPNGILVLGPAQFNCGTTVIASAQPTTIVRGGSSTISAAYTNASRIKITDSAGATVVSQTVSNLPTSQTFTFSVLPTSTETYRVTAFGSGICSAEGAPVVVTVTDPPCPTIRAFSANPTASSAGGDVVLTWDTGGAAQVLLSGAPVAASGSMVVRPAATTTYTLQATGAGGWCPQTAQVTVTVAACPSIEFFRAAPPAITVGGQSTLSWNVLDSGPGVTVTLNGSTVAASGSLAVTPAETTTYTLRVSGPGGCPDTQMQVTVTVNPPACPDIVTFTISPSTLTAGGSVTIQWSVSNPGNVAGVRLTGPGIDQSVAVSGTLTVTLPTAGTHTFTLTATPSVAGCSPVTVSRTVQVDPPGATGPTCPALRSFAASASCVAPGANVTLTWDAADADNVTITDSNGVTVATGLPLAGSITVNPASSTVYTLSASRASCSTVTRPVSVQVTGSAPRIQSYAATPSTIRPGDVATISYSIVGAASATINGSPVDPTGGSFTVSPASTSDYVLVAQGGGCSPQSSTDTLRVTVQACPQPRIDQFTANPPSVIAGGASSLAWSVSSLEAGATVNISGPGVNVNVGASGSMSVTPPATPGFHSYTLTAFNPCDPSFRAQQTVTVEVRACPPPQIVSFSANPLRVVQGAGGFIRLAWQIDDPSGTGVSVSISPGIGGGLPQTGFVDISVPAATTTYTLTATGGCGTSSTAQVTVTVSDCPAPQIVSFAVDPSTYQVGTRSFVTLSWNVVDAAGSGVSVEITSVGSGLPLAGSADAPAPASEGVHTFTLTAVSNCDPSARSTAQVTVAVTGVPDCTRPPTQVSGNIANSGNGSTPWLQEGRVATRVEGLNLLIDITYEIRPQVPGHNINSIDLVFGAGYTGYRSTTAGHNVTYNAGTPQSVTHSPSPFQVVNSGTALPNGGRRVTGTVIVPLSEALVNNVINLRPLVVGSSNLGSFEVLNPSMAGTFSNCNTGP